MTRSDAMIVLDHHELSVVTGGTSAVMERAIARADREYKEAKIPGPSYIAPILKNPLYQQKIDDAYAACGGNKSCQDRIEGFATLGVDPSNGKDWYPPGY